MDAATFRATFPAFSDVTAYPDAAVAFWLGLAKLRLSTDAFGDLLDYATGLFVAHNLTLAAGDQRAAARPGSVGATTGVLSSKSIDKVSASYDVGSTTIDGAAQWNATRFGVTLYQLMRGVGAGGLQL